LKLTVRGGYGIFYDWVRHRALRPDLARRRHRAADLLIFNPGFPDPFLGANSVVLPGGARRRPIS
jgi:hypothetical protein